MIMSAKEQGINKVFVPEENAYEGSVVDGVEVYPASHIKDVLLHIKMKSLLKQLSIILTRKLSTNIILISVMLKGRTKPKERLKLLRQAGIIACL